MGGLLLAIAVVGCLFVVTGIARKALAETEAEKGPRQCRGCVPCRCCSCRREEP